MTGGIDWEAIHVAAMDDYNRDVAYHKRVSTRTELACLQSAVEQIHTDALARWHTDPAFRAETEANRAAWQAETNATMDAAMVRASGPHPFWPDERNTAAMERAGL